MDVPVTPRIAPVFAERASPTTAAHSLHLDGPVLALALVVPRRGGFVYIFRGALVCLVILEKRKGHNYSRSRFALG